MWFCDCCEKWVDNIHIMEDGDESLCDDCLESYLQEHGE